MNTTLLSLLKGFKNNFVVYFSIKSIIIHIMVKIYYPYPANDGKHKHYIITKSGKKNLVQLVIVILQFIKMKQENKDI